VDYKLRILTSVKQHWGARVTGFFPRQGHYAHDASEIAANPPADVSIDGIGELAGFDINRFAPPQAAVVDHE